MTIRAYDPLTGQLGRWSPPDKTTSKRIKAKFASNPADEYRWRFCELCWRQTEYVVALEAIKYYERLSGDAVKEVVLTEKHRAEARREAEVLTDRYRRALAGEFGPYEPGNMLLAYCDIPEMRGNFSDESFFDQVERRALRTVWKRKANVVSKISLPGDTEKSIRPSRLYCEHHNPRRGDEARRNYQRDRKHKEVFEALIRRVWSKYYVHRLPSWDIESHVAARRHAYRLLYRVLRQTTIRRIERMMRTGITNQTEIARRLGISRQAVSVALKRRVAPSSAG